MAAAAKEPVVAKKVAAARMMRVACWLERVAPEMTASWRRAIPESLDWAVAK